jgi:hypothetical protein
MLTDGVLSWRPRSVLLTWPLNRLMLAPMTVRSVSGPGADPFPSGTSTRALFSARRRPMAVDGTVNGVRSVLCRLRSDLLRSHHRKKASKKMKATPPITPPMMAAVGMDLPLPSWEPVASVVEVSRGVVLLVLGANPPVTRAPVRVAGSALVSCEPASPGGKLVVWVVATAYRYLLACKFGGADSDVAMVCQPEVGNHKRGGRRGLMGAILAEETNVVATGGCDVTSNWDVGCVCSTVSCVPVCEVGAGCCS